MTERGRLIDSARGKQFRNGDLNQAYLLPPSLEDWLPEGHVARFVAEVGETLDLSGIYASMKSKTVEDPTKKRETGKR